MKTQVCWGKTCSERFSEYIVDRVEKEKARFNLKDVTVEKTLCMGHCKVGPNVKFDGNIVHYMNPIKTAEKLNPTQNVKTKSKTKPKPNNKKKK